MLKPELVVFIWAHDIENVSLQDCNIIIQHTFAIVDARVLVYKNRGNGLDARVLLVMVGMPLVQVLGYDLDG
jgi:hypothetical protein